MLTIAGLWIVKGLKSRISIYLMDFDSYISETYKQEFLQEQQDSEKVLKAKFDKLKQYIEQAHYVVIYTGAGISTSTGIPDYRGSNGIWIKRKNNDQSWQDDYDILYQNEYEPSSLHYKIADLVKKDIVKSVISTNVDGLHVKSGLDRKTNLIELHGNKYVEECRKCKKEYYRDKPVENLTHDKHQTKSKCNDCGEFLYNNLLNFGETYENVPSFETQYDRAFAEMCRTDLLIVIGSSLLVPTACDLIDYAHKPYSKIVIINKQKTPKDGFANLLIHSDCQKIDF